MHKTVDILGSSHSSCIAILCFDFKDFHCPEIFISEPPDETSTQLLVGLSPIFYAISVSLSHHAIVLATFGSSVVAK